MSKPAAPIPTGEIRPTPLAEALGERYLAYAMSTIVSRSLPDVRDGLKPVHRRLLYAMRQLKLDPEGGFKKCARVVGDVIGKYHPHGDVAVYDTLVRLAQDFAVRYPLVEGQGNFGNIDGDNAAAMRYTEAKLTAVAMALMDGLDQDASDFRPTYDGSEEEPVVMPASFPNLLANGATGIAVGMATSIPPHNVGELCDLLDGLIADPGISVEALAARMPGPDFPTGGVLVEDRAAIEEAYRTGRGSFRLRARWDVEKLSHGLYQIIVTEMPYQVQKARLIERIAELLADKKLPLLGDIRDESAEDVRLVLEPRNRTVEAALVMEQLFRQTDLEVRVPLNMNVLDAQAVPRVMNLKEVLRAFLDHRMVVLERRSRFRRDKIVHRLDVLEGLLKVYADLDTVVTLVRTADDPKAALVARFALSEIQVEAILNMRLRSLNKVQEVEIRQEHRALSAEKATIDALLTDEGQRWQSIAAEMAATRATFGLTTPLGRRRTELGAAPDPVAVPLEACIEREPITLVLSEMGWVRALKGHVDSLDGLKFKEGDQFRLAVKTWTTDRILVFASDGRFFTIGGDRLPSGRGQGEPIRLMIDLGPEAEILSLLIHQPGRRLLLASESGRGFIVQENEVVAQTRAGKMVLSLGEGDRARFCLPVTGDAVAIIGQNRKMLVFRLDEIPEMTRGRGVILQKYRDSGTADIKLFTLAEGLSWSLGERTRSETDLTLWLGKRAAVGRLPPNGFPRSNRFA